MDLRRDSYLLLRKDLESIFLAHVTGLDTRHADRQKLASLNFLADVECEPQAAVDRSIPPPTRSVAEGTSSPAKASVTSVIEVAWIIFTTQRRLATENIANVIDYYRTPTDPAVDAHQFGSTTADEGRLIGATNEYAAARRFIPSRTSCLLDTLSLSTFLKRRQLTASIVFGVNPDPFTAHAWLQSGDLALNETVSYARMHTPILVV